MNGSAGDGKRIASGIHLVHKPAGPTSFSVVQQFLQRARADSARKPSRICHGGTLDPFACGLLLILVEPATRLFDYLHDIPKTYEVTVSWGEETDNGDPIGNVVRQADASHLTDSQLDAALESFVGWHEQVPHPTSARRVDGERAYIRAHRGETVEMPAARVYLHSARWITHDLPRTSRLELVCRGGFYVRAMVRDLGRHAGCAAHVAYLRRTAIGPWSDPDPIQSSIISGDALLPWLATRNLSDAELGGLRQGLPITSGELSAPQWSLPVGFPSPADLVRGLHRDKLHFLLKRHEASLQVAVGLKKGV